MRPFVQLPIVFLTLACLLAPSLAEDEIELPLLEEAANEMQEEPSMIVASSDEDATNEAPSILNNDGGIEEKSDELQVWLPIIEVQFICDHDFIRPASGNSTDYLLKVYQNLYNELLPEDVTATRSTLHHLERFSVMEDIAPTKWYYPDCNMTSPQLLASLKVKGKGTLSHSASPWAVGAQDVHEHMNEASIKNFFARNVCSNMTDFRAYVESPKHHHQQSLYYTSHSPTGPPKMAFEHVEHSLLLLCGEESLVYYEEGPPDGPFLFMGFFAGFLMVRMIATELQKYDQRPHPLGGRRRDYNGVVNQEVEMV